jgi:hypothetical protein
LGLPFPKGHDHQTPLPPPPPCAAAGLEVAPCPPAGPVPTGIAPASPRVKNSQPCARPTPSFYAHECGTDSRGQLSRGLLPIPDLAICWRYESCPYVSDKTGVFTHL